MTRKKVELAFIANDSARKATYKKRTKGLMKKVSELSTLCDIDACAIVQSPYDSQPEVWPDVRGAQKVLAQMKRMPEMEQAKKMVNQESYTRTRIEKAADKLNKVLKENREKEISQLMYECLSGKELHGLAIQDLNDMGWLLDQNLNEIYKRIEELKIQEPAVVAGGEIQREAVVEHQWFTEWMGTNNCNDQNQQQQMGGSYGGGDEMIVPFNEGSNGSNNTTAAMWSNVFFP